MADLRMWADVHGRARPDPVRRGVAEANGGHTMTARAYRIAYSSWLALGGSPSAPVAEVVRWWRG